MLTNNEGPIGFDCKGINDDNQPYPFRLELQLERAANIWAGFRNLRSFPPRMLDFNNPDSMWVKRAHERNQALRAKNGRGRCRPHGIDWQDDVPDGTPDFPELGGRKRRPVDDRDKPLNFFDRLALGDAQAGHILYLLEEELGPPVRFE
jgi:hypothetical protein